jgi:hypothetical protein
LWVLRHEFQVGERGDHRDREGDQERQPRRPADLLGDLPDQGVDPGPQDVADDEQQQQLRAHHPAQSGLHIPYRSVGLGHRR